MKKLIRKIAQWSVLLVLLSLFSTAVFAADQTVTGLGNYYNVVNVVSGQSYVLNDNVYLEPFIANIPDNDNLSFTLENPDCGCILSNNNGIWTISAPNFSYVGTAEFYAAYTDENGKLVDTFFDVDFVTQAVPATGIDAQSMLTIYLNQDSTQGVHAILIPENTTEQPNFAQNPNIITYTSSNPRVVTVNRYGTVTGVSAGTAIITSTYNGKLSGTNPVYTYQTSVVVEEGELPGMGDPDDIPCTSLSCNPEEVYLAPTALGDVTSTASITVTPRPADTTDEISVSCEPYTVAGVVANSDGTYTVRAIAEGDALAIFTCGDQTAQVFIHVSSQPVIYNTIDVTGSTPDDFTVTVTGVRPNPAVGATGAINNVSIFTWTGSDQSDMQCYRVTDGSGGTYSYRPFTVNGNDVNTFYWNPDLIMINVYGSLDETSGNFLGASGYSWINSDTAPDKSVAYITYQENVAFNTPTVFDETISGQTGKNLHLEGLRVSSAIEGVRVNTEVHAANLGWMEAVEDGHYAGTMHEDRALEAVRLTISAPAAQDYHVIYQVHERNNGWTETIDSANPPVDHNYAGSVGENRPIEAIRAVILPIGETTTFPNN